MMSTPDLWIYLQGLSLFWLAATFAVYLLSLWINRRCRHSPLVNPIIISIAILSAGLMLSGTQYKTYFNGAQFIHFLLGPATVALAVPLYKQLHTIRRFLLPLGVALIVGSLTAIATAVGLAWLLGGSPQILLSLAPKSVTTPIAMGISETIGGIPALTAALVVLTGMVGATFGSLIFSLLRIHDAKAQGLALGVASHGLGTARALQLGETAGAFSGLGMSLNGVLTALLIPVLLHFF